MSHELYGDERHVIDSPISKEHAYLIAESVLGAYRGKEDAEMLLKGLSENDRALVGSILTRAMGKWDIKNGPNPYAEVVYSMFPPVGGA